MEKARLFTVLPNGIPYLTGHFGTDLRPKGMLAPPLINFTWDLWFMAEGESIVMLPAKNTLKVTKGQFLLIPPMTTIERQRLTMPMHLWFCHFDFRPIPRAAFATVEYDCWLREPDLLVPLLFSKKEAPMVWQAYRDFLDKSQSLHINATEIVNYSTNPPWQLERALINLVAELALFARRLNLQPAEGRAFPTVSRSDTRLEQLCQDIRANPAFPWNIEDMARSLNRTHRQLSRMAQATLGKSLKNYIMTQRLHLAMHLIQFSTRNRSGDIKQIGLKCGFSTPQIFSHRYKEYFGFSPFQTPALPEGASQH